MANVDTAAGSVQQDETPLLDFSFRVPAIGLLLVGGLILRLVLATLPGFGVDIGLFQFWSIQLAERGPWDFYDTDFFTDYAPGYMYVLLFIGKLHQAFDFSDETFEYILKLPAIVADLGSAYVLYKLLEGQKMETRIVAAALWLVFPAALLIGPIWGQVDSLLAFFLLLSIYYIGRDRPVRGALAFTLGFMVKPQAIAALPFLAIWIMRRNPPVWLSGGKGPLIPQIWLRITGISLVLVLLLILPFFTYEPWKFIEHLYNATDVENYRVNSFWAYNFWNIQGIFESGFKPDDQEFLGITHRLWGFALFGASLVAIIAATWRGQGTGILALGSALSIVAFYLFLTRMHERYIFPAMLPMLAACVLLGYSLAADRIDDLRKVLTPASAMLVAMVPLFVLGFAVDSVFLFLSLVPPLLALAYYFARSMVWVTFLGFAALHTINLYHVYIYDLYNDDSATPDIVEESPLKVDRFYRWLESGTFLGTSYDTVQALSFLMVVLFPIALATAYALSKRSAEKTQRA